MFDGFKVAGMYLLVALVMSVSPTMAISTANPSSQDECRYVTAGGAIILGTSPRQIGGCGWTATPHEDTPLQKVPILEEYPIVGDADAVKADIVDDVMNPVPGLLCIDTSNSHAGCDIEKYFCGSSGWILTPNVDYHYWVFVLAHLGGCDGVTTSGTITLSVCFGPECLGENA